MRERISVVLPLAIFFLIHLLAACTTKDIHLPRNCLFKTPYDSPSLMHHIHNFQLNLF